MSCVSRQAFAIQAGCGAAPMAALMRVRDADSCMLECDDAGTLDACFGLMLELMVMRQRCNHTQRLLKQLRQSC